MSFIGLVTRKEKDTGVTLLAKIVTPSKKKSARKAFKVKVKANALDDYSCCVIDHATIKNRLENSQDLGAMVEDITLSYNGIHGTTIRYEINDKPGSYPSLTDYIGEDGKLLGRPKYSPGGVGNAEGTLTIIVNKGNAEVRSNLQIAVKGITADEVFTNPLFTKQKVWEAIRGYNAIQYNDADNEGGNHNIDRPLTLVNEIRCDELSTVPVKVTYTITDDLIQYIPQDGNCAAVGEDNAFRQDKSDSGSELVKARINVTDGSIHQFSFASSAYLCGNVNIPGSMITDDSMVSNRRVRLGGLTIAVNMSLDESTTPHQLILSAATMSKYMTNEEVWKNLVKDNFKYFSNDIQQEFSDTVQTITKMGSATEYALKFPSEDYCTVLKNDLLGIKEQDIKTGIMFGYVLFAGTDVDAGSRVEYDVSSRSIAFKNNGSFVLDSSKLYRTLTIDFAGLATLPVDKRDFTVHCDVQVGGFSNNGDNPIGSAYNITRQAKFHVNIPSSAPSGS